MPLCKLCKINEANKTGSHNVPFFMIKSVDNEAGTSARHKEIGFKISDTDVTGYFGQSILPEKLDTVFGELTEDEIKNSRSSIIEDYIFCKSCEDKFGDIENKYAPTLNRVGKGIYESNNDPFNSMLFWIAIFWRVSTSETAAFKMSDKDENKLCIILNIFLNKIDSKGEKKIAEALSSEVRYKIIRSPEYNIKFNNGSFFVNTSHKQPYSMLLSEYGVFLYMKNAHLNCVQQLFFGFEKHLTIAPSNSLHKGEMVLAIDNNDYFKSMELFALYLAKKRAKSMNEFLDKLHIVWGGHTKKMHQDIRNGYSAT